MSGFTMALYNFFARIFINFSKRLALEESNCDKSDYLNEGEEEKGEVNIVETESDIEEKNDDGENEISLERRTIITKLYMLEQKIELFKHDFPNEYSNFLGEIQSIRETYDSSYEEVKSKLTFEIDPEFNSEFLWNIEKLDKTIQKFIEREVKFSILSKKLQMLIVKLNILYNVSISYPNEKEKAISQVNRAIANEMELVLDFKSCDYILSNYQLKERLVTLISYADYEIFKIILRNSDISPEQIINNLVLFTEFKDFDYILAFKAFLEDELSDLDDLMLLVSKEDYCNLYEKRVSELLSEIAYSTCLKEKLFDKDFWSEIFGLETCLLGFLQISSGKEKSNIKVKLIDRMNISVKEREVLTLPKTNAYLTLTNAYSKTHDDRVLLLIKLFKNVSDEINYKGIYFLLLLFEAMNVIKSTTNTLNIYMEKYSIKYPYDSETIKKKKMQLLSSSIEKHYMIAFPLDEDEKKVLSTLKSLNIDFKIENENILINSFYFNGLENVFNL